MQERNISSIFKLIHERQLYSPEQISAKREQLGLEVAYCDIKPYLLPFLKYDIGDFFNCSMVDSAVYEKTAKLLQEYNLGEHCQNICSILKQGYNNIILSKLDAENNSLLTEIVQLGFLLRKEHDITSIIFQTVRNQDTVIIKHELLLSPIILLLYNDYYPNIENYKYFLPELHEKENRQSYDVLTIAKKEALFNIIFYLFKETQFFNIPINEFINSPKISNLQSRLVANLLMIAKIEDEDEIESPAENIMRNKILRLAKGNTLLAELVTNSDTHGFEELIKQWPNVDFKFE